MKRLIHLPVRTDLYAQTDAQLARIRNSSMGILLADEPTADLDDENTHRILKLLRKCADDGLGVLLVTHESEAEAYADRILHMESGVLKEYEK